MAGRAGSSIPTRAERPLINSRRQLERSVDEFVSFIDKLIQTMDEDVDVELSPTEPMDYLPSEPSEPSISRDKLIEEPPLPKRRTQPPPPPPPDRLDELDFESSV